MPLSTLQAPYILCLDEFLPHLALQDMLPMEFSLVIQKKREQPFLLHCLVTTQRQDKQVAFTSG